MKKKRQMEPLGLKPEVPQGGILERPLSILALKGKVFGRESIKNHSETRKKINYKDLLNKYKLLSELIERIPDVIYFKDKKGRLIMVNQAHAKGLGLSPEEVVGKTDFDIFPKKKAEKMTKDDEYVMRSGKPIIDKIERATRPDGIDNFVSTTKIPRFDEKGNIIGLMGITRDITHRMQLEYLKEEKGRIEERLKALEELNRTKTEFVSVVSHELRTPMAIIKEAITLIFDKLAGPINEKQKGILAKAINNIERLSRIVEDLLDISRIEKRTLRLRYSLVNLNDLIRDSSEFFKKQAEGKNIRLQYHLPAKQVNIFMDAERIIQVISNLINNAIKFTEENGEIRIEVKILENKIRIGIIDTGIGIACEDLPKLFTKFVQVCRIPGTEKKGLGLGLAITKELVEKHGGIVWCESKLGVGSKFYFTLPGFYTTKILSRSIKEKINLLLKQAIIIYLINLTITNLKEFKRVVDVTTLELFGDLKIIIEAAFKRVTTRDREKLQIAVQDYRNGIYSIIYPGATEKKAIKLCELIRDKIKDYFAENGIKNVFINIGILSYPLEEKPSTTQRLSDKLYVKRIYIGPELRRAKRIACKINIEIILPNNKIESSQTLDLSKTGICFISGVPLETDAQLKIKLQPPQSKKPICINGRVAWKKRIEEGPAELFNTYKVGVEFVQLKTKDKKALSELIKSVS